MSARARKGVIAFISVVSVYALTPIAAGIFKTYDVRGPKIYVENHHRLLYQFGYYTAGHHHHDGKPRTPFMRERPWFYGLKGRRMVEHEATFTSPHPGDHRGQRGITAAKVSAASLLSQRDIAVLGCARISLRDPAHAEEELAHLISALS